MLADHMIRMPLKILALALTASAQGDAVQNRPYTDLRPFHFGVDVAYSF